MWTKGKIDGFEFIIKHFEEGSEYGIDQGRISKLSIIKGEKIIANYDRGWDIEPKDTDEVAVFQKLLKKYN